MTHKLKNIDRRKLNLDRAKISEVLPEYFQSEYNSSSDLITLFEKYYNFLDSDGQHAFKTEINNIISSRDADQTDIDYLDQLFAEIGNGLTSSSFFQNPRLMAKLLPLFYSSKGTLLSAEGFFRGFFGEEVEISYPKDNLLYVGGKVPAGDQGFIGYEDQFFIQSNELYQIFSVLVSAPLSAVDYEVLYKKFVHPAGFFLGTEVFTDGNGILTLNATSEDPLDPNIGAFLVTDQATGIITTSFVEVTGLTDSDNTTFRLDLTGLLSRYQNLTLTQIENFYGSFSILLKPNSFTFDDSNTGIDAATARPDISLTTETMDNDMFTRYLSDSSI